MRHFIIISFLFHFGAKAQTGFADSLLALEYMYYTSHNVVEKQALLLKKINTYLRSNNLNGNVFNEIKRVNPEVLGRAVKTNFLWNAAVVAYLNNETAYCRSFLNAYTRQTRDTSVACGILTVLANKYSDTALANKTITGLAATDTLLANLDCFANIALYNRGHKDFYMLCSVIVPGLGTAMNGEPLKGILSLGLTGGALYGVYVMAKHSLYINTILLGGGLFIKFYHGNIRLTEKTFEQKENRHKNKLTSNCELQLEKILTKYPLVIKAL